jgi:hypothetical protein
MVESEKTVVLARIKDAINSTPWKESTEHHFDVDVPTSIVESVLIPLIESKERKLEAENKRLREALKPFVKFANEMKKMGGTFPKTGTVYGLNVVEDHGAELTVEDFNQACAALRKE